MLHSRSIIEQYKADLGRYTPDQLRYIDEKGVWSLGQLYDHLILTALDYLEQAQRCASASAEQPEGKTAAGEQLFKNGAFPPIRIKLPDGPSNHPSNERTIDELVQELDRLNGEMSEWEVKMSTINPNCKVKHDGFGWLNAQEWFAMIEMHSRHHLRQKAELEQRLSCRDRSDTRS
ncbi:hypothetical protein FHS18_002256 [Paenibacillus phyllosphaerae]|uniref:DinB-like domain-containing protein n=1 Tax=Paenibacillus phyllosphaerae TaxID=274593 RepID=A0A7W5FMN4_9BACL|nr:DinB family protein [Paenibacillus phyllosphaerae]MBB3110189.1 hypothetical protein [Paenibacillus phyllosphaerae]